MLPRFTFFVFFLFFACQKKEILYRPEPPVKDNLWLNENTLQILVIGNPPKEKMPAVYRREKACSNAKGNIIPHLTSLYAKANTAQVQTKILYAMYLENEQCQLVVEVFSPQLKKKLK